MPMILLNGSVKLILRLMGFGAGTPEVVHTEQELRTLLTSAQTTGGFTLNRLFMLENIFDLGRQTVKDAMILW
jgi:CBS domain containing-hemolysin-like protein